MNTDMQTMGIILAAQNAGSGQAGIYMTLSPAITAAAFGVLLILIGWIILGIIDCFIEK